MKPLLLFISIFLFSAVGFSQEKLTYVGTIGDTTKIEMELSSANGKDYTGRYRTLGKKEWTLLKGALYYDNRKAIHENIVLHEFGDANDKAVFDLYKDGSKLTGTWQINMESSPIAVKLMIGEPDRSSAFDGAYAASDVELQVKTISDNSIEVNISITTADKKCAGIKFAGKLIKVGTQWKGSLVDEFENGEAAIIISFASDKANIEIVPAFVSNSKCKLEGAPFMREMHKHSN